MAHRDAGGAGAIHPIRFLDRAFVLVPIQALAAQFLQTMQEYPPSQTPGSFNLTTIDEKIKGGLGKLIRLSCLGAPRPPGSARSIAISRGFVEPSVLLLVPKLVIVLAMLGQAPGAGLAG